MKILITGGKTVTALKLIKAFDEAEVLLGDYGDIPSLNTTSYSFESLGAWNGEVLAHNLLTKCLDFGVDTLLPLYEDEIKAVAKSLVLFSEFGIDVLVPDDFIFQEAKAAHWAIFEKGKIIYHNLSDETVIAEMETTHLNGAYYLDLETKKFAIISVPNPIAL